ncbi:unnamed protein product [Gongylonema pulchrum]|uniref:F-box domain-containing protein n=1 Tax=Gongylonema pulchrum TaxID=637853 RepID=A0A183E2Y3_9BILA|nr:unnamed protein product [Gongylonema pulchrum]
MGIFRPLSNYYALTFEMKGERYRSVEHYAYQRLFDALRLDDKCIEKIRTTVEPAQVAMVAKKVFAQQKGIFRPLSNYYALTFEMKGERYRSVEHYAYQRLFDALRLDDKCIGEEKIRTTVEPAQVAMVAKKVFAQQKLSDGAVKLKMARLDRWRQSAMKHKGNKAGLLLMELRSKFAAMSPTQNRIPLVSPLATTMELRSLLSAHMICFTAESVFHFLYPALIQLPNTKEVLPSPAHFVARQAIKYFNICAADAAYINETEKSIECWERMNTVIESSMPTLDKIQGWYMDERQRAIKISLSLMFDQHAPLMKALLDTGDALLVYCSRYSTPEAELTVGMRERDLRAWLAHIDIDTRQVSTPFLPFSPIVFCCATSKDFD